MTPDNLIELHKWLCEQDIATWNEIGARFEAVGAQEAVNAAMMLYLNGLAEATAWPEMEDGMMSLAPAALKGLGKLDRRKANRLVRDLVR